MQCVILTGQKDSLEVYLAGFIKEKNISPFYIYRFDESLKINESREIKSQISKSMPQGQSRVFVISCDMTTEVQNSLLKTIEELDSNTYIFILTNSLEKFLPTIVSRSRVVNFAHSLNIQDENIAADIRAIFFANDVKERNILALKFCEKITRKENNTIIQDTLLSLRNEIKEMFFSKDFEKEKLKPMINVAYRLEEILPLLEKNNVNKKFALENIFLHEFKAILPY